MSSCSRRPASTAASWLVGAAIVLLLCSVGVPRTAAQGSCPQLGNCSVNNNVNYSIPITGGFDFFSVLNPAGLVASAVANAANISVCPARNGVVIVNGSDIFSLTSPAGILLNGLSVFACANIAPDPNATYIVGVMTTAAPNAAFNMAALDAIVKQNKIKPFGMCMAVQPCKNDWLFGFAGLSIQFPIVIPPLPPATGEISLNALSVSESGTAARIRGVWYSLPLWKNGDRVDKITPGGDIVGNLLFDGSMTVNWGFTKLGPLSLSVGYKGQLKMLIKYSNPTRFALQMAGAPLINLGPFPIDLKVLGGSTQVFLFYMEYYSDSNWNLYAGYQSITDWSVLTRMLPGNLGKVLTTIVSVAVPSTQVVFNIHANQDGGGVRLWFQAGAGLTQAFTDVLRKIGIDIPDFKAGLGVRLSVLASGKVFGYVNIAGFEYGTTFCTKNSDCDSGQVCTVGVCSIQYGCARSFLRTPYSVLDVGVCPDKTYKSGLLCYTPCPSDKPFTPTPPDPYCYESTKTCGCATTAGVISLCSGPCKVLGATISSCGCGIRSRGVSAKPNSAGVSQVCPTSKPDRFLDFCYDPCPTGWTRLDSACVRNSCPPQFPQACSSGLGSWCVKPGSSLGCAQISAAFAQC